MAGPQNRSPQLHSLRGDKAGGQEGLPHSLFNIERRETIRAEPQTSTWQRSGAPDWTLCSSTIACWLKTTLEQAGIDTAIFKAHSTRGASTSAAALRGVTTSDIIQAADWSSDSVFRRFYYKPVHDPTFGKAILSKGGN